jgi:hypothetical protein
MVEGSRRLPSSSGLVLFEGELGLPLELPMREGYTPAP